MTHPNIERLDLSSVINRLKRDEGLTTQETKKAIAEYKAYLNLRLEEGIDAQIHPTVAADLAWHHHILDTKKYMADCDAVFGAYLHHNPNTENSQTTQNTYKKQQTQKQPLGAIANCY